MDEELESVNRFYNIIVDFFVNYSLQIVGAIIISPIQPINAISTFH